MRKIREKILAVYETVKARPDLQYLFIFALVIRLCYLMLMFGHLNHEQLLYQCPDSRAYVEIGSEMLGFHVQHEDSMVIFGPGYGAFLCLVFLIFGLSAHAVLLIQVLLSSLSCLFVYKLGKEMTASRTVGLVAGYFTAVSFTSVSLASMVLSDCLYFFLFALSNLLFLLGLKHEKRRFFILAGVVLGYAILVRAIGQLWLIVILLVVFILPLREPAGNWLRVRLRLLKKAYLAPLIALMIVSVWVVRNYYYHGEPMLTFASGGGPGNLAIFTVSKVEGISEFEARNGWLIEYRDQTGDSDISRADLYRILRKAFWRIFLKYPLETIVTYSGLVWENVNSPNDLYRAQLPAYKWHIVAKMRWLEKYYLNYLSFWLSMAGLIILSICRKWPALIFLGCIYSYSALMIGFTRWQGSRLFYPGQIAVAILVAFLIVTLIRLIINRLKHNQKAQSRR